MRDLKMEPEAEELMASAATQPYMKLALASAGRQPHSDSRSPRNRGLVRTLQVRRMVKAGMSR